MNSLLNQFSKYFGLGLRTMLVWGLCAMLCLPAQSLPAQAASLVAALPPGNAITDPQSLLRLALPIDNDSIRNIQTSLEDIAVQIRGRRWNGINSDVAKAISLLGRHRDEILASVSAAKQTQGTELLEKIATGLADLKAIAEAKDGEQLVMKKNELLAQIGDLEAAMVDKFPFEIPAAYQNLPKLKGRATVNLETNKGLITVVVDGYSAPITAGNFVDLVQRGFYNGLPFTRAEEAYVLQTGDPQGPEVGFVDPTSGKYRSVPLEILLKGDKQPVYGQTLEEAGRYLESPVLPFSAYGTLAMARPGDDVNGGSSQFFFLLFEPELTPAGSNLLDGRYSVFGYVVSGKEVLGELKQGDKILSAKVVDGLDNFAKA